MQKSSTSQSGISALRLIFMAALCSIGLSLGWYAFAATPSSGTLSQATPVLEYTGGPFLQSNPVPVPLVQSGPTCGGAQNPCDSFALTTSVSAAFLTANPNASAKVTLSWTDTGTGNSDYDLYIYNGVVANTTASTPVATRSASGANPEVTSIFPLLPGDTQYTIKVVPYQVTGETIRVRIELLAGSGGAAGFPGFGGPDPTVAGDPRYLTYYPPAGTSAEAGGGEMNIGFNPDTGRFMLNNAGPVWRVTPPEVVALGAPECCEALWEDRSSTIADTGVDPILWTDQKTGRTFASNFTGGPNALYAYTDSDGEPTVVPPSPTGWTVLGAAVPTGGADHQTIGSGPYPASLAGILTTPINQGQAVYYCSQALVGPAFCQRSDDLGASYGPGTLAYSGSQCAGLHGHIRVGPDGAAYLPVPNCDGKAGVAVSIDGGVTWQEFYIPNSLPQAAGSDSSIAIDANNNLYYFYIVSSPDATKGTMHVQFGQRVFTAGQLTAINWSKDHDLGASHGVLNSAFPEAIAGDNGRAAVGFIGSDRQGDFQSLSFPGYWYAFMSTTFNHGDSWVTTNVSPNDPVQGKGGVWQQGGSQTNRNLLDFNEITIDDKGRPAFGYDDGCVGECVGNPDNNSFTAHMRLARQSGGRTLFASQDQFNDVPNAPIAPKAPCLSGTRDQNASHLTWVAPDNGGSNIIYYKVFRGTAAGNETFLADTGSVALPNTRTSFDDTTANPTVVHYFYKVQAVTAVGAGALSNEIDLVVSELPPVQSPCTLPGITVLTDPTGDSLAGQGGLPQHDIQTISVAEPFYPDGSQKLVFTIKVANLSALPPETTYPLAFTGPDGNGYYVGFRTSAPATPATPRFEYGTAVITPPTYTFTFVGTADAESNFQPDGTIRIVVPRNKFGLPPNGPPIGSLLTGFYLRVRIEPGVTPDNCPDSLTPAGTYPIVGNAFCAPNPLLSIVSRKQHGSVGSFDVALPTSGPAGIEPRSGGANGAFTLIYTFNSAVGTIGTATSTDANVNETVEAGPGPNQVTVNLTGVANAQNLEVILNGVQDSGGANLPAATARMGVLLGDTTASRSVNSTDVSETKSQSGQALTATNFRVDVTANGAINSTDVLQVKLKSGTALP